MLFPLVCCLLLCKSSTHPIPDTAGLLICPSPDPRIKASTLDEIASTRVTIASANHRTLRKRLNNNLGNSCSSGKHTSIRFTAVSVPRMLYRHRLDFEHHVRRNSRQLPGKLTRLCLTQEHILLLHLPADPLLTLPNHMIRHLQAPCLQQERPNPAERPCLSYRAAALRLASLTFLRRHTQRL
jgi:hypothetical protein